MSESSDSESSADWDCEVEVSSPADTETGEQGNGISNIYPLTRQSEFLQGLSPNADRGSKDCCCASR